MLCAARRGKTRITRNESVARSARNIAASFSALVQAIVALQLSISSNLNPNASPSYRIDSRAVKAIVTSKQQHRCR